MESFFNSNSEVSIACKVQAEDLQELKALVEGHLACIDSLEVRQFLQAAKNDDGLLSDFLKGRKNNVNVAWITMKRYAENKYKLYPEFFPVEIPDIARDLIKCHCIGLLKNTDKLGRRILFFDMTKWDTNLFEMEDFIFAGAKLAETFWRLKDVLNNGIIFIENSQGFSMAHVKKHKMSTMLKIRDIFLYSFPVSIKGFYYMNVPAIFKIVGRMALPLFPKKMRQRIFVTSYNQTPTELHEVASLDILPKWAGGALSIEEAAEDISFFENNKIKNI